MMNKALEVIEARWLFDVSTDKIDVLVHPESIVHSMVEFVDGSVVAMLGRPDMCVPIQYALTYPRRVKGIGERLKLGQLGKLTFEKPNRSIFRASIWALPSQRRVVRRPSFLTLQTRLRFKNFWRGA